ncbi:MAG: YhjD/YihY/BrkB family envelope integrity protein [Acidobacteriota bacterium]
MPTQPPSDDPSRPRPDPTTAADANNAPTRPLAWQGWSDLRPSRLAHIARQVTKNASEDSITTQSAALAFVTLLALVPLLASLSYFGAAFYLDEEDALIELVGRLLPYSSEVVDETIRGFVEQSQSLRGFGFVAFLFTAVAAFSLIETTINRIWNVTTRRSLRSRLNSFVLVLFWGPALIGLTYSGLFLLRRVPAFDAFSWSVPVQMAPPIVTLIGLTMLYWQVPATRVDFRAAFTGGVVAAATLEALKAGFAVYVAYAQQVSVVYGSFGVAMFFIISIQLSWLIVLGGSEIAYAVQNFGYLDRPRQAAATIEGSWIGLAAVALVIESFRRRQPVVSHERLAGQLNVQPPELERVLAPLVRGGLLKNHSGESEGYLLSCDPYRVTVRELLDLYEGEQQTILQPLPRDVAEPLGDLRRRLNEHRHRAVGERRLVDLLDDDPDDSPMPAERLAAGAPTDG